MLVAGSPATKVASMVGDDQPLVLREPVRRYVSRGGDKLRAGLDRFSIDVAGLDCLDAGASTGGFTDCLLRAGAARVIAVDVGYGQLDWTIRTDDRVTVLERTNVRDLQPGALAYRPHLVTADLSFISLRTVLPALSLVSSEDAEFLVLVKPQFEAGPSGVGSGGVVRDPAVWQRVLEEVTAAFAAEGISPRGVTVSPVVGPAGNIEFLLHAHGGAPPSILDMSAAIEEAREVRG